MLHLVYGINSLYLFVNLILVPVPPLPTHLFLHPSLIILLIHHFVHPYLPLSFSPGSKPTCFTNSTPVVSLLLPDCFHGLLPRLFLLSYSVFMAALCNRAGHYIFALWFLLLSSSSSLWSPYVIGRPYIFSSCDFYLSIFFFPSFFLFFLA